MTEEELADRLRRIQALFVGAASDGERAAAAAAKERVQSRLNALRLDSPKEYQFSLENRWSHRLFIALVRRHGLKPYRYPRQRRTTVMVRVPEQLMDEVIWPEFTRLDDTLTQYLEEVATRVISQVIHANQAEATVVESGASIEASA